MEYNNDPNSNYNPSPYGNSDSGQNPDPNGQNSNPYGQNSDSYGQNSNPYGPKTPPPYNPNYRQTRPNGMATASMVIGILSIAGLCCGGLGGLMLGSLALILSLLSRRSSEPRSSQALAGMITGIISMVMGVVIFLVYLIFIFSSSDFENIYENYYNNLPYGGYYNDFDYNGQFDYNGLDVNVPKDV